MIVNRINIPKIMADNDAAYLNHVQYVVETIDDLASITMTRTLGNLRFHVIPSSPALKQELIKAIRKSHYALELKIQFSKSVNSTSTVTFWTCFDEQ